MQGIPVIRYNQPKQECISNMRQEDDMKRTILFLCLLIPCAVFAAGGGGEGISRKESAPSLQEIQKTIDSHKYPEAIAQLKAYIRKDANNADAYNLLGFSYRKNGNLPDAFKAYEKALTIDPKHLGAHEYLGEAYLQKKEPEKAKATLNKLKGICGNCEEARDLEKAIAAYK
jgi:cytochrome c-type biogenesis protein CcmH/NrfG